MSIAANGLTVANLNFVPVGQNANDSRHSDQKTESAFAGSDFFLWDGIRNKNAMRMSFAANGLTVANLNFVPVGQNANESRHSDQKNRNPLLGIPIFSL